MTHSPASVSEPSSEGAAAAVRPHHAQSALLSLGLSPRFALFSILFAAEGIPISNLVHKDRGAGTLLEIAVVFIPLLLAIAYVKSPETFQRVSAELRQARLRWSLLGAHVASLLAFL